MPFDAIAMSAVKKEIEEKLISGRIEKIHQPERDEIRLIVKNGGRQHTLLLSASPQNPRVHITETSKPNPIAAPMFCMFLRKHFSGGRIVSVYQHGFDRVLDIGVECTDELGDKKVKHIITEIMSRHSNIIITCDGKVLDSVKRVDISMSASRTLLPGIVYDFPPLQEEKAVPGEVSEEEIRERLKSSPADTEIRKAVVASFRGTSPAFGREMAWRCAGDTGARTGGNEEAAAHEIFAEFSKICSGNYTYTIARDGEKTVDFAAYDITYFGENNRTFFDSMGKTLDMFYTSRDAEDRMRQKSAAIRKTVSNALERCRKKLGLQQEKLAEAENADKYRLYGDLITANLYALSGGEKSALLPNYYEESMPLIEIPLDSTKSPQKNSAMYYTKYRKAKTAQEKVSEQLRKNLDEIEYLTSVSGSIDIAESEKDLSEIRRELISGKYIKEDVSGKKARKKETPSAPLEFEADGYKIYVGRNNRQNDFVTCKIGKSYDMWLHVKDSAGSHVVIKNKGEEIPPEVTERAASLAAYYSSERNSKMVQVDYTLIKNVKKPSGAAPGKVFYEKYKTAYVAPKNFL